ncbi:MAG: hypothetical protein R2850_07410 [Bacteroidia bacterium]
MKSVLLVFIICISGCYVREIKDGFRKTHYCFDEINTGLSKRIHLNGYYELTHEFTSARFYMESGKMQKEISMVWENIRYAFYPNGIAMLNLSKHNTIGGVVARYILVGDTIKTIRTSSPTAQIHPLEYEFFKIIDDSTLQYLGFNIDKELDIKRMQEFMHGDSNVLNNLGTFSHAHFVRSDSLPDIENVWIKKMKWFWCDEQKYRAWKKSRKENRS